VVDAPGAPVPEQLARVARELDVEAEPAGVAQGARAAVVLGPHGVDAEGAEVGPERAPAAGRGAAAEALGDRAEQARRRGAPGGGEARPPPAPARLGPHPGHRSPHPE